MRLVQRDTVHADGLLVFLAVQLQRFQVNPADIIARTFVASQPVATAAKGLASVAESTIGDSLSLGKVRPTHGTSAVRSAALVQTLPAEAVGARQQAGVLVETGTHGATKLLL